MPIRGWSRSRKPEHGIIQIQNAAAMPRFLLPVAGEGFA
jgi:hypothetical protein